MAAGNSASPPISLLHRGAAAAGASLVSAIVVNPLDVVKVRSISKSRRFKYLPRNSSAQQ